MERVSIRPGVQPLVLIAPHGPNDNNTAELTEKISEKLDCYHVINNGFEKTTLSNVDSDDDKADCNNIKHIKSDPIIEHEFLNPIKSYVNEILDEHGACDILTIHGVGGHIQKQIPGANMIIGWGDGTPESYSCDEWRKNFLGYLLHAANFTTCVGKKGGKYSAWGRSNLNQFFRKWENDLCVHSMQLEITTDLREEANLDITANVLATIFERYIKVIIDGKFAPNQDPNWERIFLSNHHLI